MTDALAFRRLLVDGRFDVDQVGALLRRLAQPDAPRPLVFEVESTVTGLSWRVATRSSLLTALRALTADFLPGARLQPLSDGERIHLETARLVRLTRLPVPLDAERAEEVTHALYSACARVRSSERIWLQLVLGRGHAPHLVSPTATDPTISTLTGLRSGTDKPIPSRIRTRMETRAALASLEVTIRIGASAGHPQRRRELTLGVFGALQLLHTAGTELHLERESVGRLQEARAARIRRSRLTTAELVPLLGLPLGEADLPRLPRHPRRPLPPRKLETHENLFATASAPGDDRTIGVAAPDLLQHLVISGPTGSGKSTVIAAIAEQWIRAKHPLALLDPKRQLVDHLLARLPKSAAGRVVVLDVSDASRPVGFNPLDTAGRNADVVVDGILASLRAIFEDGWGPRTEDLLLAALRSLSLAGERRGMPYTLIDLPKLFTDTSVRRAVVGQVQDDVVLATFWAAFDDLSDGARVAMIAAPLNKLRKFLLRPNLVAVLGQSQPRFRVRDLFQGDHAVLVPLNEALVGPGSAQLLGSLLVAELFQATQERAAEQDPASRPGLVAIDEAQKFVHLPTAIDDALATSRGYGVGWLAAHQYRSQMAPALREGFDANARSKLVYKSRPKDARDYAQMSPTLDAEDFMSLDRYELYATLMHDGIESPWFAARALGPKPELGFADLIRETSRERFGAVPGAAVTAPETPIDTPPRTTPGRKARRS
jgi:Type IV secretory system Conjugative DNA transfer